MFFKLITVLLQGCTEGTQPPEEQKNRNIWINFYGQLFENLKLCWQISATGNVPTYILYHSSWSITI